MSTLQETQETALLVPFNTGMTNDGSHRLKGAQAQKDPISAP